MRKILYVAFEFPPRNGGGVQRALHFANNLPACGIDPVVITTDRASYQALMPGQFDDSLTQEIDPRVKVIRIPVDPRSGGWRVGRVIDKIFKAKSDPVAASWSPNVQRHIDRIVKQEEPDAILVTAPPFSLVKMWAGIANEYGIPLLLDLRDAWSQWCLAPYSSIVQYWNTLRLERAAIDAAAATITTSYDTRADLLRVHSGLCSERLHVIHNGYPGSPRVFSSATFTPGRTITIGYVGTFYYSPEARRLILAKPWQKSPRQFFQYVPKIEDWLYRSPYFFFKAISYLLDCQPELRQRLRLRFAGPSPDWLHAQAEEFGLASICEFLGYLPRDAAIQVENESDLLLLTSAKVSGGRDYSIAGKTYEYFERQKPIIAFVCEGAQKDMLERSGCAIICDPDDFKGAAFKLKTIFNAGVRLVPDTGFLAGLSRESLAQKLAGIIKEAVPVDGR